MMNWFGGGCHCGAVRFRVRLATRAEAISCNCSICSMTGFIHLIVGRDDFELVAGRDSLTSYRFNTGAADHLFCARCGVKSFYVPRSHPDGYSVNLNCVDPDHRPDVTFKPFDGANWEDNISKIR
ncbi:MAG: GFA family protein [Sphingomonadales bacterium]